MDKSEITEKIVWTAEIDSDNRVIKEELKINNRVDFYFDRAAKQKLEQKMFKPNDKN